jgi:2Fe-2S ferredoxin
VVKIVIENLAQKKVLFSDSSLSMLKVFQQEYIDWMHACGGKGRCTTCRFRVQEGMDQLSPPTSAELKYRGQGRLSDTERLACQTHALGDCRIVIPEDCKLPHVHYSD